MARYRVLSLDGGGIRGLLTIIMLQRLEQALPGWLAKVDLIAGVSSGGIIALLLSNGVPVDRIRCLVEESSSAVFTRDWLQGLYGLGGTIGPRYRNTPLFALLRKELGNTKLADLKKQVLIPAFDLDNGSRRARRRRWAPRFFHNFSGSGDGRRLACKVGLYTSAAPAFFPAVDGYVDGGVFMTNPSMAALAQTQEKGVLIKPTPLGDITLFSVGTGWSRTRISGKNLKWGKAQWRKSMMHIVLDGSASSVHYQCGQMLGQNYLRVSPSFPDGEMPNLDSLDKLPVLIQRAESMDLSKAVRWLQSVWVK